MCGIAGLIEPNRNAAEIQQQLLRMTDSITHRGPDDHGHVMRDAVGIGMRRLSIIDVVGGHQPISNENGRIWVVCNGEIYNFLELRSELEQRGHRFRTGSDTEVIVHAYEQFGDEFLPRLRGMFGLAIWDQQRDRLLLARDRLGKKPLFYAQQGERFYFGSEMKSLLAADSGLRAPDYRRLGQFFQDSFIGQPNTIYRHIRRLPAAHYGVFEKGQFQIRPYWSVDFTVDESVSDQQWEERLEQQLVESVKVRLHSEVPLGVFLSGGLDSSAIAAHAHLSGLRPLKTFTIGFDRREWDESDDALRVAKHLQTDHHLLRLSEAEMCSSFEETLHAIVRHCDEPFGDPSALPTYHVSRLAREHVTVILSGDGADELFAGYSSYRGAMFAQRYRRCLPYRIGRHLLPAALRAAAMAVPGKLHYQALRAAKVCRDSALPFEQAYRDKTSVWTRPELNELLTPEFAASAEFQGDQYMHDDLWKIMRSDRDLISRLTEIDMRSFMLDGILVKVDRMSMAHSLEVRSPLLDHKMVELAAQMPSRIKLHGNVGKRILRKVMRKHLPSPTLQKAKQGFRVPLRDWFRGDLSSIVHDYLGPGGSLPAEIFSPAKVESILTQHQKGNADHSHKIWLLMTFAAWHRQTQQDRISAAPQAGTCGDSNQPAEAASCES